MTDEEQKRLDELLAEVLADKQVPRHIDLTQGLDLATPSDQVNWLNTPLPPLEQTDLPTITVKPRTDVTGEDPAPNIVDELGADPWADMREIPKMPPQEPTFSERASEAIMHAPALYEYTTRPLRRMVTGAGGAIAALPWNITAGIASIPALIPDSPLSREQPSEELRATAGWLADQGTGAREAMTKLAPDITTADVPETPIDVGARKFGENFFPIGGPAASLIATTGVTGLQAGLNWLMSPSESNEPTKLETTTTPPETPYSWLDTVVSPAEARETRPGVSHKAKTAADINALVSQSPAAQQVIDTVGGPRKVKDSELYTMGGLVLGSIGMAFAPQVFSRMKFGGLPRLREVKDAVPGTMDITTPLDVARAHDDITAGALRAAARAGLPAPVLENLEATARIQTRAGAQALANSAVTLGHMETPGFTFHVDTSLPDLAAAARGTRAADYLHVLDTIDDIKIESLKRLSSPKYAATRPGPIEVRGLDLPAATALKNSLEAAEPELIQIARGTREYMKAVRKFEAEGEYATLSRAEQRAANKNRPNEIPFHGGRVYEGIVDRGDPFESIAYDVGRRLRHRMENEYKGSFVTEVRKVEESLFKPVQVDILDKQGNVVGQKFSAAPFRGENAPNPNWAKNVFDFKRRGKNEYYTTSPSLKDMLDMDPYYITGAGQSFFMAKRMLEMGATGIGAPFFAPTSAIRSYFISKVTAPTMGRKAPGVIGSFGAIARQILPQMAHAASISLERGSARYLGNLLGQGNVDALATRLAYEYQNSLYYKLRTVGGSEGSILRQQAQARGMMTLRNEIRQATAAAENAPGVSGAASRAGLDFLRGFAKLYSVPLKAIHNAPSFAYARKNLGAAPLPQVALEARQLTGDPRAGGQYYTGRGRPIRFESDRLSQTALAHGVRGYGALTEAGRTAIPWYNATVQGIKRIGQAYLDNPIAFVRAAWLSQIMPSAALYLYARSLGDDPAGRSYVDHMLNGRSTYNSQMNWYIPLPGRLVEDGIELPNFHELTSIARLTAIGLDHLFGSSLFAEKEDFAKVAAAFVDTAIMPPPPPILGAFMGAHGVATPMGGWGGGGSYKVRQDPYDQTGGMPANVELIVRALAGGIGDMVGSGAAAFIQTPKEQGTIAATRNALREAGLRGVSKTPLLRDIVNVRAPVSGQTDLSAEMWRKKDIINKLSTNLHRYGLEGDLGDIEARGSKGGQAITDRLMGPAIPSTPPGLSQPEPTNPLYVMFMQEVRDRFKKDEPKVNAKGEDIGGIGFPSMLNRYNMLSAALGPLRKINEGNYVTWQEQMDKKPELKSYLQANNVDTTNLRQVRNFYEKKRQDAARVILFTIRATEADFAKRLGKPNFKIEDLDPYDASQTPD
jgi:hypothetical protein